MSIDCPFNLLTFGFPSLYHRRCNRCTAASLFNAAAHIQHELGYVRVALALYLLTREECEESAAQTISALHLVRGCLEVVGIREISFCLDFVSTAIQILKRGEEDA